MNQYIDLSIKKIEIKNPKRDLKAIIFYWEFITEISLLQQVLRVRMVYSFQDLLLIGWRFLKIKSCVRNLLWLIWSTEAMEYRRDLWMLL